MEPLFPQTYLPQIDTGFQYFSRFHLVLSVYKSKFNSFVTNLVAKQFLNTNWFVGLRIVTYLAGKVLCTAHTYILISSIGPLA